MPRPPPSAPPPCTPCTTPRSPPTENCCGAVQHRNKPTSAIADQVASTAATVDGNPRPDQRRQALKPGSTDHRRPRRRRRPRHPGRPRRARRCQPIRADPARHHRTNLATPALPTTTRRTRHRAAVDHHTERYTSSEIITRGTPPDLDSALAQSRRLHPSLRDDHLDDQPHPSRPTPRHNPSRLQTPPRRHLVTPTRPPASTTQPVPGRQRR